MSNAHNVLEQIRTRLDAGEHSWAIGQLRALIDIGASGSDVYRLLALAHLRCGAFDLATAALDHARAAGTNSKRETAFGRFLNGEGYRQAALNCFQAAVDVDPENADAVALICMHYGAIRQHDLAVKYGQKCLELRDRQGDQNVEAVKCMRPKPFNPSSPRRNIISFSLFGNAPYYWESAIANASAALAIYPEWRCRFYCDESVPDPVRKTLLRLKSQLFVRGDSSENWSGLFWRFHAFDDPDVDAVMIRDVDSPFTLRERLAVDEWLASEFPFHAIRDHIFHCEPLMAGLWAGFTGLLPPMNPLIETYTEECRDRYADQKFLRLEVWPRIRHATLAHDRYFKLGETRRPPNHVTETRTHIGMAWPRQRRKDARV